MPGCERHRGGCEHFQAGQPPTLSTSTTGMGAPAPPRCAEEGGGPAASEGGSAPVPGPVPDPDPA